MVSKPIIFGLAGSSCSGKTTIALNLIKLFPHTVIVHQDDFYKPDSQIPLNKDLGIQDWDCPEAFDMSAMVQSIRSTSKGLQSIGATNNDNKAEDAQSHFASQWANPPEDVDKMVDAKNIPFSIVLVEGILLFHDRVHGDDAYPATEFDAGMFIYAEYQTLKSRREARAGYTTKEGFWADPPGYFDSIVYPNFIKCHESFIQRHPGILDKYTGTTNKKYSSEPDGTMSELAHIAVCSSDAPAADILSACVYAILDVWKMQQHE
ncbi:P-loop containing nucleoside triphosphate hydrolase protein [Coemansia spiralis]|nr:P-loop containing nucleoside triphosphate hydrolase protein [Coemansia spiralis]